MANSNDRNLNVTIRNQADERDEVVISVSSILKKLKKYFLPWIIIAAMVGVYMVSMQTIDSMKVKKPITALVGFNYAGVEKGLDPKGGALDVNSLKNPEVITDALSSLDIDLNKVETVRSHISIAGIIPSNAIDRITLYKSVINQTGSITAAQNLLDTTYFSTQYKVTFNYSGTGLSTDQAVEVLNTMLEKYRDYFYKQYGYNQSLGSAVSTNDYSTYDYAQAVDLFKSSLTTLQTYLKKLADEDVTRFRSSKGYTFGDLYESVKTVSELDLDKAESLVTVNNLTKDKNQTLAFYKYKIETLGRQKDQYIETFNALTKTRESYQKDQIIIMQGAATTNSEEGSGTNATQQSEEYDKLIEREYELSANIAKTKQQINTFTARLEALQKASKNSDELNKELVKELEHQLERINEKVNNLVDLAKTTTDEYYQNVQLANAYSVLVPSTKTATSTIKDIIEDSMRSVAVTEALIFLGYFGLAFISAIISENRKKTKKIISDLRQSNAAAAAVAGGGEPVPAAAGAVAAEVPEVQEPEAEDDTDEIIEEVAEALGAEVEVTEAQEPDASSGEKKPQPVTQKSSKKSKKK